MATFDAPLLFVQLRGCSSGRPQLALERRTLPFADQGEGSGRGSQRPLHEVPHDTLVIAGVIAGAICLGT